MTDLAGKGAEALAKHGAEKIQDAIEHFLAEEEPVTTLKAPCPHGRYDAHRLIIDKVTSIKCSGGTLLPDDTLVIVKEDGEWPKWATGAIRGTVLATLRGVPEALDALAAAQGRET